MKYLTKIPTGTSFSLTYGGKSYDVIFDLMTFACSMFNHITVEYTYPQWNPFNINLEAMANINIFMDAVEISTFLNSRLL